LIKNTIIKSSHTRALISIIAVASTLDYVEGSSDKEFEQAVIDTYTNYKGNTRFIENVTNTNLFQYRFGIMSRIMGWLNSCLCLLACPVILYFIIIKYNIIFY
jgi:hypothetical protein